MNVLRGVVVGSNKPFRNKRDTAWEVFRSVYYAEIGYLSIIQDTATLLKALEKLTEGVFYGAMFMNNWTGYKCKFSGV